MEYVSALVPPAVMATFFIFLVRAIIRTQGGPNMAKEDAAADAIREAQLAEIAKREAQKTA